MKHILLFLSLVFFNNAYSQIQPSSKIMNQNSNNLLDFGAVGDGKTNDSAALLRAISIVSKQSSKNIIIPNNYNFNLGNVQIDLKKFEPIVMASFPDKRMTAIAPLPEGVAKAIMVSF